MIKLSQLILLSAFATVLTGCEKPAASTNNLVVQAELSTETLRVGDSITLTLTATHPTNSTVRFPILGTGRQVVVRDRFSDTREHAPDQLLTEEVYQLTSFRVGDWPVTTTPAILTLADGSKTEKDLPELLLHVQSTLTPANANKLSDIKGLSKKSWWRSLKLWVPLLIALIALVVGLITLFLKKKKEFLTEPEPIIPPHLLAQQALAALHDEPWNPEPFFVQLSLILRTYLEGRFDLKAPESTTEELAEKLHTDPQLEPSHRQMLRTFFTQADLVKFARAGAEQNVMRTAFSTITQFVTQTAEYPTPNKDPQNEES